jgi:hypothetical protein
MAGAFPDVPGHRFEYDRDGSIMVANYGGHVTLGLADMQALNDESFGTQSSGIRSAAYEAFPSIGVAWPELRDVTGFFADIAGSTPSTQTCTLYASSDTTNVLDGTWVAAGSVQVNINSAVPATCRTDITPLSLTAIRGVCYSSPNFTHGAQHSTFHVYGQTSLTENPHRLVLCDASGAAMNASSHGAYFDFGDSPRGTIDTKSFRIRNISSTYTATSIAMSFQQLYDASPTLAGQFQYNFGSGWVTTGNIGNLSPGGLSGVIQMRRNTLLGAAGGPWQSRVVAVPASMI